VSVSPYSPILQLSWGEQPQHDGEKMVEGTCNTCKYANHAGYLRDSQGNKIRDKPVIYCELEWSESSPHYDERYLSECPAVNSDCSCQYHVNGLSLRPKRRGRIGRRRELAGNLNSPPQHEAGRYESSHIEGVMHAW